MHRIRTAAEQTLDLIVRSVNEPDTRHRRDHMLSAIGAAGYLALCVQLHGVSTSRENLERYSRELLVSLALAGHVTPAQRKAHLDNAIFMLETVCWDGVLVGFADPRKVCPECSRILPLGESCECTSPLTW